MTATHAHDVEEIKIYLPYGGFVAGKWWGDRSVRPFLCLHGRQDNAGTFDRLIPLLSNEYSYLAIDFPGHGKSSRIPNGVPYHIFDYLIIINHIYDEYKWDKISLITHSMSSTIAYTYAGIYPHRVDMIISFDILKPRVSARDEITYHLTKGFEQFLKSDERNQEGIEPPAYTHDEIVKKLIAGTGNSVNIENAKYLLERNIQQSKKHPAKYFFSRDRRLQSAILMNMSQEDQIEIAKRLTMPFLFIKASNSSFKSSSTIENDEEALNVLKKHSNFQHCIVESDSHHVHLVEAEKVATVINEFIKKHKKMKSHL